MPPAERSALHYITGRTQRFHQQYVCTQERARQLPRFSPRLLLPSLFLSSYCFAFASALPSYLKRHPVRIRSHFLFLDSVQRYLGPPLSQMPPSICSPVCFMKTSIKRHLSCETEKRCRNSSLQAACDRACYGRVWDPVRDTRYTGFVFEVVRLFIFIFFYPPADGEK